MVERKPDIILLDINMPKADGIEVCQEMLIDYFPDGTIDREKTVEMLQEGMKQIRRMDVFIDSMQKMNSLEHRTLKAEQISPAQLEKDIQKEMTEAYIDYAISVVLSAPLPHVRHR